eukprot:scaffold272587_cov30-Tisochrysis_lutea.AAC.1
MSFADMRSPPCTSTRPATPSLYSSCASALAVNATDIKRSRLTKGPAVWRASTTLRHREWVPVETVHSSEVGDADSLRKVSSAEATLRATGCGLTSSASRTPRINGDAVLGLTSPAPRRLVNGLALLGRREFPAPPFVPVGPATLALRPTPLRPPARPETSERPTPTLLWSILLPANGLEVLCGDTTLAVGFPANFKTVQRNTSSTNDTSRTDTPEAQIARKGAGKPLKGDVAVELTLSDWPSRWPSTSMSIPRQQANNAKRTLLAACTLRPSFNSSTYRCPSSTVSRLVTQLAAPLRFLHGEELPPSGTESGDWLDGLRHDRHPHRATCADGHDGAAWKQRPEVSFSQKSLKSL